MHQSIMVSHLTQMENVVVGEVLRGKANKNIASDLILSQRTIEAHRANAFQKMRVRNAIELTRVLPSSPFLKISRCQHSPYERQVGPVWFSSSGIRSRSG